MVRGSDLQFHTNYNLKAKIWLAVACFILDRSDQESPAALTPSIQMDRENLKDVFKSKGRGANCLKWWKCKQIEPYAAGKRKKKWWWQRREEMLRIKSNIEQELKLEEKREGGAHEQACSQAQSTHWPVHAADLYPGKVSASPTGCPLRQTEKPRIQPATSESSAHARQQRGEQLPPLQCALSRVHAAARQAGSHFFWLDPVARHRICCLTHQTKCRAIIYHHKHNSRLLPNEGCSL